MRTITILLAEDNFGDQNLFTLALNDSVGTDLKIVNDGVDALHFLRREDKYASSPRPDLVILDLNLPRKNGPEVLAEMRRDPALSGIPVAVFTGARPTKELADICKLNANFYIIKPDSVDRYFATVKALEGYCRSVVEFPDLKKEYADELRRHMIPA